MKFTAATAGVFAGALAASVAVFKSLWIFKTILPNEKAVKIRWGKVVKKYDRGGIALAIPGVHHLARCEAFEQVAVWPERVITLGSGLNLRFALALRYRVEDLEKALIRADNLEEALSTVCHEQLTNYLSGYEHLAIGSSFSIARHLETLLQNAFASRGVGNCILSFHVFGFEAESPGLLLADTLRRYVEDFCRRNEDWTREQALSLLGRNVIMSTVVAGTERPTVNGHHVRSNGNGIQVVAG